MDSCLSQKLCESECNKLNQNTLIPLSALRNIIVWTHPHCSIVVLFIELSAFLSVKSTGYT